jgi:hypothetical protein
MDEPGSDKSLEEVLIDIAREHPDFYEKYVITSNTEHYIDTLYGGELADMLIEARIPFDVGYPMEFQARMSFNAEHIVAALTLMSKLRGSKLR